jgi:Domain of unknown function (DUF397)
VSENLIWIKSSYSGSQGSECVEVAELPGGGRAVRDSKDPDGPVLTFGAGAWRSFTDQIKAH